MMALPDAPEAVGLEGRIRRVRQEPRRRDLQVMRAEALGPGVRRLTFGGDDLADFASHAFDDHVKLFVPSPDGGPPVARDYTPRRFDAQRRELDIEFALHGDGPAATWAREARPGDRLAVAGPRGSIVVPDDLDWYLLVGDSTSLPAIARRLEELPASAQVTAIVQMDAADRRELAAPTQAHILWVDDAQACLSAVRAWQPPPGLGFAWCAGEAGSQRELRRVLVEEKGVDRHAVRAAAYWKHGAAGHHERIDGAA